MRAIGVLAVAFAVWCVSAAAHADELATPAVRNPAGLPAGAGASSEPVDVVDPSEGEGDFIQGGSFVQAGEGDTAAAYAVADAARPIRRRRAATRDIYHPSLPMGETRSAWTAPAVAPTPFALTAGEAMTPMCGRLAVNIARISDERILIDDAGRQWESDGEVRIISVEVVSPCTILRLGSLRIPVHASASIHAYTLEHGIFERIRNFVEEDLLGASDEILASHDIGGRELHIDGQDLLGSTPMWKLRFGLKFPLRRVRLGCCPLYTSLSIGATLPSFGASTDAGNEDVQPDFTLAYAMPLGRRIWLTGAATVSLPGTTERFDELGVDTEDVLVGANINFEYWFSGQWAASLGFQYQTPYLVDTGLAMDEWSTYFNIGILWRPHPRHTFHLVFSENPQTEIASGTSRDYTDSQRDSDFTMLLGWRYGF